MLLKMNLQQTLPFIMYYLIKLCSVIIFWYAVHCNHVFCHGSIFKLKFFFYVIHISKTSHQNTSFKLKIWFDFFL